MNSKNAVHAQLFFEFKQFSKNDMRLSGQALSMSTLLEIEKAAEMLPSDQWELFGFLLTKLRMDGPPLMVTRIFSAEEMNAWMDEDEADLRELTRDA